MVNSTEPLLSLIVVNSIERKKKSIPTITIRKLTKLKIFASEKNILTLTESESEPTVLIVASNLSEIFKIFTNIHEI